MTTLPEPLLAAKGQCRIAHYSGTIRAVNYKFISVEDSTSSGYSSNTSTPDESPSDENSTSDDIPALILEKSFDFELLSSEAMSEDYSTDEYSTDEYSSDEDLLSLLPDEDSEDMQDHQMWSPSRRPPKLWAPGQEKWFTAPLSDSPPTSDPTLHSMDSRLPSTTTNQANKTIQQDLARVHAALNKQGLAMTALLLRWTINIVSLICIALQFLDQLLATLFLRTRPTGNNPLPNLSFPFFNHFRNSKTTTTTLQPQLDDTRRDRWRSHREPSGCSSCEGCGDCWYCTACIDCVACRFCEECRGCEGCEWCNGCVDCEGCVNCIGCVGLKGARGVVGGGKA